MVKFKMTCPNCNAATVTKFPEAMIWELCPACRHHVWDGYDALMADVVIENSSGDIRSMRNIEQSN